MICSSCSNFTEVPLYFFNCPSLSVINCTFINNTSSAQHIFRSYEGNSGSLSYGWNNVLLDQRSAASVYIYNCTFYNNSARGQFIDSTGALEALKFTGRGGGIALIFNATDAVNVTIEHTMFQENFANVIGGGLYLLFDGISINQSFNIHNNTFLSNTARSGAAGIVFAYLSSISPTDISIISVRDCSFIRNHGGLVGAISIAMTYISGATKFLQISNCKFHYNTANEFGAAIGLHHADVLSTKRDVSPLEITDWLVLYSYMLNKNTLGVERCETNKKQPYVPICVCVCVTKILRPRSHLSKMLHFKLYLNDIQ